MPRAIVNGQPLSDAVTGGVDPIDRDFGDGSLGDVTIAADVDLRGDQQYNSLVVNDGVRVSAVAMSKLTIRSRSDITLNGSATIDAHGRGVAPTIGGNGGTGTSPGTSDQPGGFDGPFGTRPYAGIAVGGTGGGGGGGGSEGTDGVAGQGGDGGSVMPAQYPFSNPAADYSAVTLLQRFTQPLVADADPVTRVVTIPADTLLRDGDALFYSVAFDVDNNGESFNITLDGVTIANDTNLSSSQDHWRVQGWITKATLDGGWTGDAVSYIWDVGTGLDNVRDIDHRKVNPDWSTDIDLVFTTDSNSPNTSIAQLFVYKYSTGIEGAIPGGIGGVGSDSGTDNGSNGSLGSAPPTDATLIARMEMDKDTSVLASSLWGSPGSGGGGGGGGNTDGAAGGDWMGGMGGSPGSQAGPTGFGDGGAGNNGQDHTAVSSRQVTGGGGGGSGGAGGGDLEIWCNGDLTIGTGTINANGGDGGVGGDGGDITMGSTNDGATGGGAGGGGGGSGGTVLVVVNGASTNVISGTTVTALGGTGAAGGTGGTSNASLNPGNFGKNGAAGQNGANGVVVLIGV